MKIEIEDLRKIKGIGNNTMDRIYESLREPAPIQKTNLSTIPSFSWDGGTIYNGDALSILHSLTIVFNAVITDLPYAITSQCWDVKIPFDKMWGSLNNVTDDSTPIVLFGNEPFTSGLRMSSPYYKYDWKWEKERLVNIAQVKKRAGKTIEDIPVFYKSQCTYNPQMVKYTGAKRSNKVKNGTMGILCDSNTKSVIEYVDTGWRYPTQVLRFQRDILKSNLHPTQKPLALIEWLIKTYTNEGDTILDFTAGSFTTAIAAMNTNRKFIGIELDNWYFKIGKIRILFNILLYCHELTKKDRITLGILEKKFNKNAELTDEEYAFVLGIYKRSIGS